MIDDKVLGNILNSHKKNRNTDNVSSELPNEEKSTRSSFVDLIKSLTLLGIALVRILVLGYGTKLIFSPSWNFIETICIGVLINFIMNWIQDLFHSK